MFSDLKANILSTKNEHLQRNEDREGTTFLRNFEHFHEEKTSKVAREWEGERP